MGCLKLNLFGLLEVEIDEKSYGKNMTVAVAEYQRFMPLFFQIYAEENIKEK